MKIQGSTFLVTGGSSGLGAATAQRLAGAGANVFIADLNSEAGEAHAAQLGKRAKFVKTNVASPEDVQNAVDTAVTTFGGLKA